MRTLFVLAALFAGSVQAAPVEWTFVDVTFDDGSITSGSFVFDANAGQYSSINLITICGTACAGTLRWESVASQGSGDFMILNPVIDDNGVKPLPVRVFL